MSNRSHIGMRVKPVFGRHNMGYSHSFKLAIGQLVKMPIIFYRSTLTHVVTWLIFSIRSVAIMLFFVGKGLVGFVYSCIIVPFFALLGLAHIQIEFGDTELPTSERE